MITGERKNIITLVSIRSNQGGKKGKEEEEERDYGQIHLRLLQSISPV